MARKNPIERRVDRVSDQWVEFAEAPNPRLLCWLAKADERPMVDAFIGVESDEQAGTLPDLFLRLRAPFMPAPPYGVLLRGELCDQARALEDGAERPASARWAAPEHDRRESDVAFLVRTCVAFAQHFELPGHLALLLEPEAVSDPGAFLVWLQQAIGFAPANVRLIVVDDAEAPALSALVKAEPVRIVARPLDLDMAAARLQLSQEAGGLDTPGGQFRHLFVKLTNALGANDIQGALGYGQLALGITAAQGWFALAVPVHFALGAALAGLGRSEEANQHYGSAEIAATEGERAGDATCTKLKPQARMVRGGLLINMRLFRMAAQLFVETIPMAIAAGDARMALDGYRLASFCYEQDGQYDKAWQQGVDGLAYARTLDKETAGTSTVAYLGEGMMRLAKRPEYSSASLRIEREMVALTGRTDWRPTAHLPPDQARPPS
jgi:hypothetical protein